MQVTTIEGIIKNGQIVLTEDIQLPEMSTVYVIIPQNQSAQKIMSPKLVDNSKLADFKREIIEINEDEI